MGWLVMLLVLVVVPVVIVSLFGAGLGMIHNRMSSVPCPLEEYCYLPLWLNSIFISTFPAS